VREGKASFTAGLTAAARAAESMKPDGERRCYDPLARDFLGTTWRIIARSPRLTRFILWLVERLAPGVPSEIISRTKYIDDCLGARIADGIEQLVILGTGYDSRPYRFGGLRDKVRVFEVDHPATLEVKMRRVKKVLGSLPENVVFVPIDFESDGLDERLFQNGYDRSLKTFYIWEGVTYYLTARAIDETLSFVADNSASGSSIVFDYAFQSVLEGAGQVKQVNRVLKAWERIAAPLTSEHFIFGVREGTIEEFLSRRGFSQIENINGNAYHSGHFNGMDHSREAFLLCGFVHAHVYPASSPGLARRYDATGARFTDPISRAQERT
jgi:methyltransferase (TIGR00027 family)